MRGSKRYLHVVKTIEQARKLRKAESRSVGLVPTMGALHQGHLSLVDAAKAKTEVIWASIFVNPSQFAPHEDFNKYPRQIEKDLQLLEKRGVDVVFAPSSPQELYPKSASGSTGVKTQRTFVVPLGVEELDRSEGKVRPGHFRGVATVVSKLFNILQPNKAFFGQKDGLQCLVIKQLVEDLNFDVEVVACPTVREKDGLAMSSRNVYLSFEQRHAAPVLFKALTRAQLAYSQGERKKSVLRQVAFEEFQTNPKVVHLFSVQYLSFVDLETGLEVEGEVLPEKLMISAAIDFGNCRILDNILCGVSQS
jgi:pantoate--beta-alanine ligase